MNRLRKIIEENADALRFLAEYDAGNDYLSQHQERPTRSVPVLPRRFGHVQKTFGVDHVLDAHKALFGTWKGRVRVLGAVESACLRPVAMQFYDPDITDACDQAAALISGIAEAQGFIDGNKRTALVSGLWYLSLGLYRCTAPQWERASWLLDAAAKVPFAGRLRATTVREI